MLKYGCSFRWVQWKYAPGHQQRLCWFDYGDIVWHRYHVTAIKQGMFYRRRRLASRWYPSHTGQTETKPTIKANFLMNRQLSATDNVAEDTVKPAGFMSVSFRIRFGTESPDLIGVSVWPVWLGYDVFVIDGLWRVVMLRIYQRKLGKVQDWKPVSYKSYLIKMILSICTFNFWP